MTGKIGRDFSDRAACSETSGDGMALIPSRRRSLPEDAEPAEGFFLEPLGLYLLVERRDGMIGKIRFSADRPKRPLPSDDEEALLGCWLKGVSVSFKLDFSGLTEFQREVLEVTSKIPPGETITYGELAERVGRPNAARAVGQALGKNPFPLIIPCHRVVGLKSIGGYSSGVELKRRLLLIERDICQK